MSASKIICIAVSALSLSIAIGGTIVANNFAGIIDDYLDNTNFGFGGEEFQKAAALSDELCQKIGEDGVALLRNENNTLPYATKKVNVFGWSSIDNGFLLSGIGSGSSSIRENKRVTLLQAFKKEGWQTNTELTRFYENYDNSTFNFSTGNGGRIRLIEPGKEYYSEELINNAKAFSDQAVMVISRVCGENVGEVPVQQNRKEYGLDQSRSYLHISQQEEEVLDLITKNFSKVTVIVNSSNTMELGFLKQYNVGAALNVSLMGQSGALAIPRILSGAVNPSGRVADTFVYDSQFDTPSFVNRAAVSNNIGYFEGVYVGYRYYETADAEGYWDGIDEDWGQDYDAVVQFPFGHGLSYTTFEWNMESLEDAEGNRIDSLGTIDPTKKYTISFSCTNTGSVKGKDVMQVYGHVPYYAGEIEKSSIQLLDFVKSAELDPGHTQHNLKVQFSFYDLASYDCYDANHDDHMGYELDDGDYHITFNENAHSLKKMASGSKTQLDAHIDSTIDIDVDPVTGHEVKNRFTGNDAYADMPIDGSKAYATAPGQLTRADGFWDWGLSVKEVGRANVGTSTFVNHAFDQTEMPTHSVDSGLRIRDEEGKWNEELVDSIGDNFEAEALTKLVNQLTPGELKQNVECSGFGTPAMPSVGKPECFDFDGPAGFNQNTTKANRDNGEWTAFPCEVLIAQTWDKDLAYQMGASAAAEGTATGLTGWYAPGVNIHRTPYSGRNYEYYSEDPILSGKLAAQVSLGAKNNGLYVYVKHFTLSEEGPNPKGVNTWLTEQAYREIYLRPFEITVKEGKAVAIMSAFNNIGNVWAGACAAQNVDILRGEWGFHGTMVTDWSTGDNIMNPERGIRAGNDVWLNPNTASGSPINIGDPTTLYCAKMAARDVLFTYINTHYTAVHYDPTKETSTEVKKRESFPWRPLLYTFDAVSVIGVLVWVGFIFVLPAIRRARGA